MTLTINGKPQVNNLTLSDYGYAIVKENPALPLIEVAVTAGSLNSLSWTEIETIADSLANGLTPQEKGMQLLGLSKEFKYNSKNTCYAFVIGVLQDYLDTTPRGLTF